MKIRIYMKNGTVLPDFECEEFTVQKNNLTGEITGYSFKGGEAPRPLFLDLSEVLTIWRVNNETS